MKLFHIKRALVLSTMLAGISYVGAGSALAACTPYSGGSLDCNNSVDTLEFTPNITDQLSGNYNSVSGVSINLDGGDDELYLTGGSVDGGIQAGAGDDYVILDGVTVGGNVTLDLGKDALVVKGGAIIDGGIGWYGRGFEADNYFIDNGVIGYLPEGMVSVTENDTGTLNPGVSIFTGELDDEIAIFGGSVAGEIQGAGGNDLIIIDANADEYTGATDEFGVAETTYIAPIRPTGLTDGNGVTPEMITGAALTATPIVFNGGGGNSDRAELFDLVNTTDLIFQDVEYADFYGQTFSLDLDDNNGSGYYLKTDSGSTNSNLVQTDGALALGGGSLIKVFENNTITMQDGYVGDSIKVSRLVLQGGSNLTFDVDASVDGYQADASDYIVAPSVVLDDLPMVVSAANPVNMDVNLIAEGALSGSRRLIDSGADIRDPGTGATPEPTANYVLVSDPSTAARTYWLQEANNDGVYLLWTTPVNSTTTSGFVGGSAVSDPSDPNAAPAKPGPEVAGLGLGLAAAPMAVNANIAEMARLDAGPFDMSGLSTDSDDGSVNASMDAFGGQTMRGCDGKAGLSAWADGDTMMGDLGTSSYNSLTARMGVEADVGRAFFDRCGQLIAGSFAYLGQANIDAAGGSATDTYSYGGGIYLRMSTDDGYYGSFMSHLGSGNVKSTNPVLGSTADYNGLLYGFGANVGKKFAINEQTVADIRGSANFARFDSDPFSDSMGLKIDGVRTDTFIVGADVGVERHFDMGLTGFARLGAKYTDFAGQLASSGTTVDFATDYVSATTELGLTKQFNAHTRLSVSGTGEFGKDVTLYGARARLQIKF